MKVILSIVFLFVLVSCGSTLKRDPVIPAIKAGYPTLEFTACNKTFHGVGVCSLTSSQDYNEVNFSIQGYYKGTGKVFSQNCDINQTFSYVNNQKIKVDIPGTANRNCLISVTLSPEYPKERRSALVIYSLRGHLALKVTNGESWRGNVRRVTGNWKNRLKVDVGGQGKIRVILRGCGVRYDKEHDVEDGFIEIELSQAVLKAEKGICVLEGLAIDPQFEDFLFTTLMVQYATKLPLDPIWKDFSFSPLATPAVKFYKKKIKVTAPEVVSVISLDKIYKLKNSRTFKFDKSKPHILRIITIKGRTVLGIWNPTKKEFIWKQ